MDIDRLDCFGVLLDFVSDINELIEMGDEDIVNDLSILNIDEDVDMFSFEYLYELRCLVRYDCDEDGNTEMYFSSEDMTEYYRLAKKIGQIKGYGKNNKYIENAFNFDVDCFGTMSNMGYHGGDIRTKTNHKFASGWHMRFSYEFYGYWQLYFAVRKIFQNYKIQRRRLERMYSLLTSKNVTEEAA